MNPPLSNFDLTAMLDSDEAIAEYLSQVFEGGDNEELLQAIKYVNQFYLAQLKENRITQGY